MANTIHFRTAFLFCICFFRWQHYCYHTAVTLCCHSIKYLYSAS